MWFIVMKYKNENIFAALKLYWQTPLQWTLHWLGAEYVYKAYANDWIADEI